MMQTKYIFIDIDSTLLSHKIGIPKSALKAIDLARKNGHKVFISTGRVASAVDDYIKFFPFDAYLFGCGGHIEVEGQRIYDNIVPTEEVFRVIDLAEKANLGFVLEGMELSYWNDRSCDIFLEPDKARYEQAPVEVRRHMLCLDRIRDFQDYKNNPTPINKFSIFLDTREELLACESLFPEYELIKYQTSAEMIPQGVDKATGMLKVLEHYQAKIEDCIAIGDSMNDYSMLQQAGFGIAMGDAVESLKEVADFVTKPVEEDGIYYAFKHLGLI